MTALEQLEELVKALNASPYPGDQIGWQWNIGGEKEKPKDDDRYPHKCPKCGGPAYVGFTDVECKNRCTK